MDSRDSIVDLARWRAETPGCAECVHLNNAGASLMPRPVVEAMVQHLELEAQIGGYEAADARTAEIAAAYEAVAELLGCRSRNVALMENATAAFAQALSAIPFERGDVLLTTSNDYVSNQIMYLALARRLGVEVVRAPDAPEGGFDVAAMRELIHRRQPKLVAVTQVPTNSGLAQPVAAIAADCRDLAIPYLVDACQAVGQMPVDVAEIGCDFLSATCRKFLRGPRGAGFLYVSDRMLERGFEPLFPDLQGATWTGPDAYQPAATARRFENWEFAYALVLGSGAAARYATGIGLAAIAERVRALAALLRQRLAAIDGLRVLDRGPELAAIVTVAVPGWQPAALQAELRRRRIHTSFSTRAFALLDFSRKGVDWALRASPHYFSIPKTRSRPSPPPSPSWSLAEPAKLGPATPTKAQTTDGTGTTMQAENAESSKQKVLRVGILAGVYNLDPLRAQDVDSLFVLRQVVEAPFATRPGTTDLEPVLFAGNLEKDGTDATVYRARLRPDVVFSDGVPLSAQHVVDCLSRVALVRDQADVEAQGPDVVVFRLHGPNPRFDVTLSHPQCSIYRREGGKLLGTGAYQLASDSTPGGIHLVRNSAFRDRVAIDEVHFRVYPLDDAGTPSALVAALEAGEVDYANVLSRDDINRLSGVRKSILPGVSTSMLYLNGQSPRLADRRLRQAIARSIDRVEVARTAYSNALAFAAPSLLPRAFGAANDDLSYDPILAAELLRQPGVVVPERLSLLMMWGPRPYLPKPRRFLEVISAQLQAIGITIEPVPTRDSLEYSERVIAGQEDMLLAGWVADVMDPADFLEANLASNRIPLDENISVSTNCGRLRSRAMDEALATYRAERSSESLERVMQVLSDEAPLVPLAYGPTTAVLSFRVTGFKPSPLSILPLAQLDLEG